MSEPIKDHVVFFDIETVPSTDEEVRRAAHARATRIAEGKGEEAPTEEEAIQRFAMSNGIYNEIVSIAWAKGEGEVQVATAKDFEEVSLLTMFATALGNPKRVFLVGYNIFAFDLKVMFQRAVILGGPSHPEFENLFKVLPKPSVAPWQAGNALDLATYWNGVAGIKAPLYDLAVGLGLVSYDEAARYDNGADVAGFVRDGEWNKLREHNAFDVHITREIYRRVVLGG